MDSANENSGSRLCTLRCPEDGFVYGLYGTYVPPIGGHLVFKDNSEDSIKRIYKVADVRYNIWKNEKTKDQGNLFLSDIEVILEKES